jgi:hypothetical protein
MLKDKTIKTQRYFFVTVAGIDEEGMIQIFGFTFIHNQMPTMKQMIQQGYSVTKNIKDITLVSFTEMSKTDFDTFLK